MFINYLWDLMFYLLVSGFFLNYYYYLKSLIMVEFIMSMILVMMLGSIYGKFYFMIYILILSVCEGILGLLLVVLMCRFWGLDSYILIDFSI